MTCKIRFNKNLEQSALLQQLKQHKLFAPLLDFFNTPDQLELMQAVLQAPEKILTIAELKKLLAYDAGLDQEFYQDDGTNTAIELLKNSRDISLNIPFLLQVDLQNLQKLARVSKYYTDSTYLIKKFFAEKPLQQPAYFLPFLQPAILSAMLQILPDQQQVAVCIVDNLNPLLRIKAMQAIREKIASFPKIPFTYANLLMSEECNLRCLYCFEPRQARDKSVISFETAKQVLRKLDYQATVNFLGGEPMLCLDLMKQICEWGWEQRNFKFALTTNGQIIDRQFFRDYLKYFSAVQLSCDGPETPNDLNRGKGAFKKIMEFYHALREETGRYPYLHMVLSRRSVPYLLDTVKWFYEMHKISPLAASLRWLPGDAGEWQEKDFACYAEQLNLLKKWYLENNMQKTDFAVQAFAKAEKDVLQLENKERAPLCDNADFCGAGKFYAVILPDGTMVPCQNDLWCGNKKARSMMEIPLTEDIFPESYLRELKMKDIPQCNECQQWGCCVCPGSFFFHGQSYTVPDKNWCRAGKMLISTAQSYVDELIKISPALAGKVPKNC